MIKNVRGCDLVGINHYDRGRKGSKMSLIVTKEGIPINLKMVGSNVHDINILKDQLDTIKIKIVGSRIIGDKGYNSRRLKSTLRTKGISLVYPRKKNEIERTPLWEKELLKGRYVVENVFSWIQNRRRIRLRYECKSKYYEEFYYLCLIELIIKKI